MTHLNGDGRTESDGYSLIEQLAERWPQTFSVFEKRRKPLKIDIFYDLVAVLDGGVDPSELGLALRLYTRNWAYLRNCFEGAQRIDLNGNAAGAVTGEEAARARRRLEHKNAAWGRR